MPGSLPKQPYIVTEVDQSMIYNFKDMSTKDKKFTKDENGDTIKWSEINEMRLLREEPFNIYIHQVRSFTGLCCCIEPSATGEGTK